MMTSTMLSTSENCTSLTEARIVCVRSLSCTTFTPGGSQRSRRGIRA